VAGHLSYAPITVGIIISSFDIDPMVSKSTAWTDGHCPACEPLSMASSKLLPPEIVLLIAMHLWPQYQLSFLRAIPSFTRSFSARHLESKDKTGNTILHLLAQDNESSLFIDLISACRDPNLPADKKNRKDADYSIREEESKEVLIIREEDGEPPIKAIISVQVVAM
jgi:hypothetical protein